MFRPIPAIIRFTPKRVFSVYKICGYVTMVRSHHMWFGLLLLLTFSRRIFFKILAHPVYKM